MKFGTHTTQHIHRTQETTADWHTKLRGGPV
jgi:hypothetical protein